MHGVPSLDVDLDGTAGSECRARRAPRGFLDEPTGPATAGRVPGSVRSRLVAHRRMRGDREESSP